MQRCARILFLIFPLLTIEWKGSPFFSTATTTTPNLQRGNHRGRQPLPQRTTTTIHRPPPSKMSTYARFRGWWLFATTIEDEHVCSFSTLEGGGCLLPPPSTTAPPPPSQMSMYAHFRGWCLSFTTTFHHHHHFHHCRRRAHMLIFENGGYFPPRVHNLPPSPLSSTTIEDKATTTTLDARL